MTGVIQFGPLAMATDRLLALAAVWLFVAILPRILGEQVKNRGSIPWIAVAIGITLARTAYVATHWEAYKEEPETIFALWQGGFSPIAGVAGAILFLAFALRGGTPKLKALGATGAIAGLWAILALGVVSEDASPLPTGLIAQDLRGNTVDLDRLRGKPFVLNFWATWCPPCLREMPMLASVAAANPQPAIFFVNEGEDAATVQAFLRKHKLSLPSTLLDNSGTVAQSLGASGLPTTVFIDADGQVRRSHFGEISRAALQDGLNLIKNKE